MREILKRYTVLILFLVSICVYLNTLTHGFVYDDTYFSNRRDLYSLSAIPRSFVESYIPNNRTAGFYRPMAIATFALTFTIFGNTPLFFHLTNIILHACVTILVFYIAKKLKFSHTVSFITALLFAVHPVHVEAVAFVKGRDEIFYGLFFLIAWWSFLKSSKEKAHFPIYVAMSVMAYLFALFSKEMAITIPVVCLISLSIARMSLKRLVVFILSWGAASILYALLRYAALGNNFFGAYGTIFPGYELYVSSWTTKIFTALQIYFIYLKTLLFPLQLSATYGYAQVLPITNPFSTWLWIPGLIAGIVTIAGLCFFLVKKKNVYTVLFASFIIFYIPVSQFFGVKGDVAAERWMYTPSIILLLLTSVALSKMIKNKKYLYSVVSAVLLLLSVLTIQRNQVWASNFTIFYSMAQSAPKSVHAHSALALEYFKKREFILAKEHAEIAESIYPAYVPLQNLLGNIATLERNYDIALGYYERSLSLEPDYLQTHIFLGGLYFSKGDFEKAKYYYEFVLQKKRFFAYEDVISYAATLAKLKQYKESLSALSRLNKEELERNQTKFLLAVNYYKLGEKEKVLENIRWNNALSRDEREKILTEY